MSKQWKMVAFTLYLDHTGIYIMDVFSIFYIAFVYRWTRNGMPLPITDDNFADMESIKVKINYKNNKKFKI